MVEVAAVTQADVPIYHEWIGVLDGLVNATIRAQVTGYLLTQNYREGDPIKKGDLLFEIDPRPFQAVLDQAKASLPRPRPGWARPNWTSNATRPLVKDKAISQEEYDDAVQANLEAKAAVVVGQGPGGAGAIESGVHQDHLADRRDRQHRQGPDRRPGRAGHR